MNNGTGLVAGALIGAATMYFLDPDGGRRRRALARDKAVRFGHVKRDAWGKMMRDTRGHVEGLWHETKHKFQRDHAGDEVIRERIRAKIGRAVAHPRAVHVDVVDGIAVLTGNILNWELDRLLRNVGMVRGVREINNLLHVHESPEGISDLQGESRLPDTRPNLLRERWKPSTSLVMGVAGGALAAYGAVRRDKTGAALGAVGMSLLARSFRDTEGYRLTS